MSWFLLHNIYIYIFFVCYVSHKVNASLEQYKWWYILYAILFVLFNLVNVAHTPAQGLQGTASMSQKPQNAQWYANRTVDGDTAQEIPFCAVMDYSKNYKSVWLKVRLGRRFNVAYLEVFFRGSSMLYSSFLLALLYSIQKW